MATQKPKIDLAFSEDGDIVLGAPRIDADGKILYLYTDGTVSIQQYIDGIEGKPIQDMVYNYGRDAYKQIILNRLRTDAPDWYHYPTMGGNLTDLIGEQNSRDTADAGVQAIMDALTYDGLLGVNDIAVRAVPISAQEILFIISIQSSQSDVYKLPVVFNLNYGLKEV